MTDTTYVAFDVWPEDGRHPYWSIDTYRPTYGATVTLTDGRIHRYLNASHQSDGGNGSVAHQYYVGAAGELHVILVTIDFFNGTISAVKYPNGSHSERILRTYAPGTWALVEGEYRSTIANVDPSVNLLDRSE